MLLLLKAFFFLQNWNENRKFRKRLPELIKAVESKAKRDLKLEMMMSGMLIMSAMAIKIKIDREMLKKQEKTINTTKR